MGGLLILLGLVGFLFGLVNLIRPLGWLRVETGAQAGLVVGASVVVMIVGGVLLPPVNDVDPIAVASTTTLPTSPSTTMLTTTSSVAFGSTTTSGSVPTTSTSVPVSPSTTIGGGVLALDVLLTIPIELETPDGYDRDLFPLWSDADGNGCDTRDEVLIRDAAGTAEVGPNCAVTSGSWWSVYDAVWLDNASQLDVDHVVALKEAWDSGAKEWDTPRREAFANDLDNPDDQCRYIVAWVIVKARWDLSMDQSEHGRIRNLLEGPCEGATVEEGLPVRPSPPATTTTSSVTTVPGSSDVTIATIVYDAPGNDVVYNDSEYVVLSNDGSGSADVGGWRLTDLADNQIDIPSGYSIPPGGTLRVYTGPGDSTASRYFAGRGQAMWNNSGGDTATLTDSSNQTVDTYSYSS